MHVLASISTKNRYHTTLPSCIISVLNQTRRPDRLIIFDDGDQINPTKDPTYVSIFRMAECKGVAWEWLYTPKRGQTTNHQEAQKRATEWVWRVDDDCMAEADCLEKLCDKVADNVGIVCGPVMVPPAQPLAGQEVSTTIDTLSTRPNIQWFIPDETSKECELEHAHCSFLYRAKVVDFCTDLSPVGHREETLFSYEMFRRGYKIIFTPLAKKWHLRAPSGGIRSGQAIAMFDGDEFSFKHRLPLIKEYGSYKVVFLRDSGIGDHFCFKPVLKDLLKKYNCIVLAASHPWVFDDLDEVDKKRIKFMSIDEAKRTFIYDDKTHSAYITAAMHDCNIENAYRKLYL